jgi:hypothetical protein
MIFSPITSMVINADHETMFSNILNAKTSQVRRLVAPPYKNSTYENLTE